MDQVNQMNQTQDDEIDLFELLQTLWEGKWLITAFVAIAILLGGGFLLSKDPTYESNIFYTVDTLPPFYSVEKVSADFKKRFYSISVFKEWKKSNSKTPLEFDDFSLKQVVDGFVLSKGEGELATLSRQKNGDTFIAIKTNKLRILDDFFKYSQYVNGRMKSEYVERAKDELNIIESRFEDLSTSNHDIILRILAVDRFIVAVEKGEDVLKIQNPTRPQKLSPKSRLTLGFSLVLGGMVGVVLVLTRSYIMKRKEQLAKA